MYRKDTADLILLFCAEFMDKNTNFLIIFNVVFNLVLTCGADNTGVLLSKP